jgi:hypothetical protein
VATWIATVLAAVLLPLGLVSSWVAGVVTDTTRYVDTVGPLASDPVVQQAAIRRLDAEALRLIDFKAQRSGLEQLLQQRGLAPLVERGALALADAARVEIEKVVHDVVVSVVTGPQFADAWRAANRSAHEQLVAVLEGDDGLVDSKGRVTVELGTVLNTVVAILETNGLVAADRIPDVRTSFALMKADDLSRARLAYRILGAIGFWLPLVWLLAIVLALVLAPVRRRAWWRVAVSSVLATVVLGLGMVVARNAITGGVPDAAVLRAVWDTLVTDLRTAMRTVLVVGLVVLAVLWLTGSSSWAVALRSAERTALSTTRAALARAEARRALGGSVAALAVVALVVLVW